MAFDINWGALRPLPDFNGIVDRGFATGRAIVKEGQVQGALKAYMANPDDQGALGALAALDPATAVTFEKLRASREEAAAARAKTALTSQLGGMAATDPRGAATAALRAGQPELAKQFFALGEDQQKAAAARLTAAAPIGYQARKMPDIGQRKAYIMSNKDVLVAQGWTPEQIDAFEPTDAALDSLINAATTLEQARALDKIQWVQVGDRPSFATNSMGVPVGSANPYAAAVGGGAAPASGAPAAAGFDGFWNGFLKQAEGGYNPSDGRSGAPVNFGINQRANPDVDVAKLTEDGAKQLYVERYWGPSGAGQLPPGLAEIQMDTAVNMGVDTAKQLLSESGGDPGKYLQLRERRYRSIGGADLPAWLKRNAALGEYAARVSTPNLAATQSRAASGTSEAEVRAEAQKAIAEGRDPVAVARMALERYGVKI